MSTNIKRRSGRLSLCLSGVGLTSVVSLKKAAHCIASFDLFIVFVTQNKGSTQLSTSLKMFVIVNF